MVSRCTLATTTAMTSRRSGNGGNQSISRYSFPWTTLWSCNRLIAIRSQMRRIRVVNPQRWLSGVTKVGRIIKRCIPPPLERRSIWLTATTLNDLSPLAWPSICPSRIKRLIRRIHIRRFLRNLSPLEISMMLGTLGKISRITPYILVMLIALIIRVHCYCSFFRYLLINKIKIKFWSIINIIKTYLLIILIL